MKFPILLSILWMPVLTFARSEASGAEEVRPASQVATASLTAPQHQTLNIVDQLVSGDPALAARAIAEGQFMNSPSFEPLIVDWLEQADPQSVALRAVLLKTLGALAWPRAEARLNQRLRTIGVWLGDGDPIISAAARSALFKYPTPLARQLLVKHGVQDLSGMASPSAMAKLQAWMSRSQTVHISGVDDDYWANKAIRVWSSKGATDSLPVLRELVHAAPQVTRHILWSYVRASPSASAATQALELVEKTLTHEDAAMLLKLSAETNAQRRDISIKAAQVLSSLSPDVLKEFAGRLVHIWDDTPYLAVRRTLIGALQELPKDTRIEAVQLLPYTHWTTPFAALAMSTGTLWGYILADACGQCTRNADSANGEPPTAWTTLDVAKRNIPLNIWSGPIAKHLQPKAFKELTFDVQESLLVFATEIDSEPLVRTAVRALWVTLLQNSPAPVAKNRVHSATLMRWLTPRASVAEWEVIKSKLITLPSDIGAYLAYLEGLPGSAREDFILWALNQKDEDPVTVLGHISGDKASKRVLGKIGILLQQARKEKNTTLLVHTLKALAGTHDLKLRTPVVELAWTADDARVRTLVLKQLVVFNDTDTLKSLAKDVALPPAQRIAAIQHLVDITRKSPTPRAHAVTGASVPPPIYRIDDLVDVLRPIALTGDIDLRRAAQEALHALQPAQYGQWDSNGRYALVGASALLGASLFTLTTSAAGAENRRLLLGIGGGVLGGTVAFLLRPPDKVDISLGEAGYFAILGGYSTAAGASLTRAFGLHKNAPTAPLWGAIALETAAIITGQLTLKRSAFTTSDIWFTQGVAASFALAGASIAAGSGRSSDAYFARRIGDGAILGAAAGALPLAFLSPRLRLHLRKPGTALGIASSMAIGSWFGALSPRWMKKNGGEARDVLFGAGVGQAVGLAAGLSIAPWVDQWNKTTLLWAATGIGTGALSGAGLGILTDVGPRNTYGLAQGLSALGGIALAALGPRLEWRATDELLVFSGALLGVVSAESQLRLKAKRQNKSVSSERLWGGRILGASLGFYSGLALSQFTDLSYGEFAMAGSAAALGKGMGYGIAFLLPGLMPSAGDDLSALTGLLAGSALVLAAPKMRYEKYDAFLGASMTVAGAGLGAFAPALFNRNQDRSFLPDKQQLGGALWGAALGAAAAGATSQFLHIGPRRLLRINTGLAIGTMFGSGLGMMVPAFGQRGTVASAYVGAVGGYMAAALSPLRAHSSIDNLRMVQGALTLGAMGAAVPFLWRPATGNDTSGVPTKEVLGGVMLGTALGAVGARALARAHPLDAGDTLEVVAMQGLGLSLGFGLAQQFSSMDRRLKVGLVGAAGLMGFAAGEVFSPFTSYSQRQVDTILRRATLGAIGGATLSFAWGHARNNPPLRRVLGGASLGAGLLGVASLGLGDLSPSSGLFIGDGAEEAWWAVLGATTGAGIGALSRKNKGRKLWRGLSSGYWGALLGGIALSGRGKLTEDDTIFLAALSTLGAYAGTRIPELYSSASAPKRQRAFGAVVGASALQLMGLFADSVIDLPTTADATASALFLSTSGALLTGGMRRLRLLGPRKKAAAIEAAATGGLFALGLSIAPFIEFTGTPWPLATGFGLGSYFGALTGYTRRPDSAGLQAGLALGAGGGLLLGYGANLAVSMQADDAFEVFAWSLVGSSIGAGSAVVASTSGDDAVQLAAQGALVGGAIASAGAFALHRFTAYDASSTTLLTVPLLWGAGLGVLSASPNKAGPSALLGAGIGAALGIGGSQFFSLNMKDAVEASGLLFAGSMMGLGLDRYLDNTSRWLALSGGVAGLALGVGLAPQFEVFDTKDAAQTVTLSLVGAHYGWIGEMLASNNGVSAQGGGGALMGLGLGLSAAWALAPNDWILGQDVGELLLTTAAADVLSAGLILQLNLKGNAAAATFLGTGLGLTALSTVVAKTTNFAAPDRLLLADTAVLGGIAGALLPVFSKASGRLGDVSGKARAGGMLTGLALGALGGGALTQFLELDDSTVKETLFNGASFAAIGTGVGLALAPRSSAGGNSDALWVGLGLGGALTGTALGLAFADETPSYSGSDVAMGAVTGLYGVYQGAGLSLLLDGDDSKVAGAMLAGGALGALGGAYFGRRFNLDFTQGLMLASGGAWGVWLGVWTTAVLEGANASEQGPLKLGVGATAVMSDIALGLTSLALGELVDMPPHRFAWISIAGGTGVLLGLSTAALTRDRVTPASGVLFGTLAGLGIGTLVTSFVDMPGAELFGSDDEPDDGPPSATGTVSALLPQVDNWFPSMNVVPAQPGQPPRYMFTLSGQLR